ITLTNNAIYVAPLNALLFLILSPNKVIITNIIVAGYIISSIGAENFIIVFTPKFDTIALNIQTILTISSYFNFTFVVFSKNCAVADVRPIAVVKQANITIIANITLPGLRSEERRVGKEYRCRMW